MEGAKPMIVLDEFDIPRRVYLKLLFLNTPVYLGLLVLVTYILGFTVIGISWALQLYIWGVFLAVTYWVFRMMCYQNGLSPNNTILYQKRNISFEVDKFRVQAEDGSEACILLKHMLQANRSGDYYRLFLWNRMVYLLIPVSAFRSEEDRIRFETEILGNKMKKESSHAILWKRIGVFFCMLACVGMLLLLHITQPCIGVSVPESELDKAPQIGENDGHGSSTYNHEFRPADADY